MKKMLDAKSEQKRLGHSPQEPRRGDLILARGGARSAKPLVDVQLNLRAPEGRQIRRPFRARHHWRSFPGVSRCALHPWLISGRPSGALVASVPILFDGLYTNDKFCHSRIRRLNLRPPRASQNKLANSGQSILPAHTQRPGGKNETSLEHPSPAGNHPGRRSALGSGLSTPALLESDSSFGDRISIQHRGGNQ